MFREKGCGSDQGSNPRVVQAEKNCGVKEHDGARERTGITDRVWRVVLSGMDT